MPPNEPTVFVVDDDQAVCESLAWLLESQGLAVETCTSAEAFLETYRDRPGCLVLDIRMRGLSGLELQERLAAAGQSIPVIILTGHGDVPMAVRALKAGAVDFLEKPVPDQVLLERIHQALERDRQTWDMRREQADLAARLRSLTRREREVLTHVVGGKANKQIALQLGIAEKTVEAHRKHVMRKMGVHSTVELVRLVLSQPENAALAPPASPPPLAPPPPSSPPPSWAGGK